MPKAGLGFRDSASGDGLLPELHDRNQLAEAYERLLHDAAEGDSTYFTRWDEVATAWSFVDRIAAAWGVIRVNFTRIPQERGARRRQRSCWSRMVSTGGR